MTLFIAKLLLTPLIMLAASLASRRWGDAVGGWLVGLPVISGPVSVYLAIERGADFAAAAAAGSLAGVVAQASFCLGYRALAARGWPAAIAAAAFAYVAAGAIAVAAAPPLSALIGAATVSLIVARRMLPAAPAVAVAVAPPRWDIPLRLAIVTILVLSVTTFAAALGPRVSGLAASFPVIGGAIAAFAQRTRGPAAGAAALRGMASALYGFIAFFGVIGFALPHLPPVAAYLLATLAALATQGVTLIFVRRDARRMLEASARA